MILGGPEQGGTLLRGVVVAPSQVGGVEITKDEEGVGAGFLYRFLKEGFYGLQGVFRGAIDVEDVYARTCGASSRHDFDEGVGDGLAEAVRLCRVRVMNKDGRAGLGILREGGVLWQAGGGGVGFLQGDGIGGVILGEKGELVTLAVERAAVPLIDSYGVHGGVRHDTGGAWVSWGDYQRKG